MDTPRKNWMVSFAQFRPEKQHDMQLRIWSKVLKKLPSDAMFIMLGSVRD